MLAVKWNLVVSTIAFIAFQFFPQSIISLFGDGDELYFETWYEDPDYRDEIVIRDFHTGDVLGRLPGILMTTPDGDVWMLD